MWLRRGALPWPPITLIPPSAGSHSKNYHPPGNMRDNIAVMPIIGPTQVVGHSGRRLLPPLGAPAQHLPTYTIDLKTGMPKRNAWQRVVSFRLCVGRGVGFACLGTKVPPPSAASPRRRMLPNFGF